ncbi:MAG: SDR family NAD(P)-dependent oxidoreductase [Saprospiraceae bacterium]|nr:SDR family NAD(P)-dependent oxidoreductase [Saprospiraceae bacterium]
MKKYIFISGISTGIGFVLAKALSTEFTIIGTLRAKPDKQSFISEILDLIPIYMDLNNGESITHSLQEFLSENPEIKLFALINNAGIAVPGPIIELPIADLERQMRVNLTSQIQIIQLLFPRLQQGESRIINISSVSGLFASPFLGAYAASKFALEGITDALRRELMLLGIKVILIEPGPLKTLIWSKNLGVTDQFPNSIFKKYLGKANDIILATESSALPVEKIIAPILHALKHTKPKNRYLIHRHPLLIRILTKFIPSQWVDKLVVKNLNSQKKKFRPI